MTAGRACFLAVIAGLALACASRAATVADGTWTIRLEDGLPLSRAAGGVGPPMRRLPMELTVTIRDGKPRPQAWGWCEEIPALEHPGRLVSATTADGRVTFDVELSIRHGRLDGFYIGGKARYTVALARQGDAWAGTYTISSVDSNNAQTIKSLERAYGLGIDPQSRGEQRYRETMARRLAWYLPTAQLDGKAAAALAPLPPRDANFTPPPTEHPRLFFSKRDLPALRAKAATPAGRQILEALQKLSSKAVEHGFGRGGVDGNMMAVWAAGEGLLFQLSGDPVHARRAEQWCLSAMYRVYPDGQGWAHSYSVLGMAMAYDLCYEAWPPEFRDRAYAWLWENATSFATMVDDIDPLQTDRYGFGNDSRSAGVKNSFGFSGIMDARGQRYRAAGALAALALVGDPPPIPKPIALDRIAVIAPDADFVPVPGTPVVPFTSGKMSELWILNGPFRRGLVADPLADLGGCAKARPVEGTRVTHDGVNVEFRTYHPAGTDACGADGPRAGLYPRECGGYWYSSYHPGEALREKWNAAGAPYETDLTLYTIIDNDRPRVVMAKPNWNYTGAGSRMWINGQEIRDGDVLRLSAGMYHMMCLVRVTGGYAVQAPHLVEYGPSDFAEAQRRWEWAQRQSAARGGDDDEMTQVAAMLTRSVMRYVERAIGPEASGGWGIRSQREFKHGYGRSERSVHSSMLPLLAAMRNLTGENMATGGLSQIVPAALRWRGFDRTHHELLLLSLGLAPREYLPYAAWYLQEQGFGIRRPYEGVMALIGLDPSVAPRHPADRFALGGFCPGHGLWLMPNGWDGAKGYLVAVEANPLPMGAPSAAGNFAILGRGREWVDRRDRTYQPVDVYTTNVASGGEGIPIGGGKVVHQELFDKGGGVVSVQVDQFRLGKPTTARSAIGRAPEMGGPGQGAELLDGPAPKMSVLRSVAVDYSGTCGMPAMVVVADRISGLSADDTKLWHLYLSHMGNVGDKRFEANPAKRSFTIAQGSGRNERHPFDDIGVQFTMALPTQAELSWFNPRVDGGLQPIVHFWVDRKLDDMEKHRLSKLADPADPAAKGKPASPRGKKRPGDDMDDLIEEGARRDRQARREDCVFIAVFTLGQGTHPKVTVVEDAKEPTVRIGRRIVTFGQKKLTLRD